MDPNSQYEIKEEDEQKEFSEEQNEEKKEEYKEEQKEELNEESKEELNEDHQEELSGEKEKNNQNIIEKEQIQEFKNEKSFTMEEKDKTKSFLKDDSYERGASMIESNSPNSFQNNSNSSLRKIGDNDADFDKIVSGKDESQLHSISIEEKDSSMKSDQEKDKNSINTLNSSILSFNKDFRIKRNSVKIEHQSIFKTIIEEKEKNVKLKDIINAQMVELKNSTLSFFSQTLKELEIRYNEYINSICDYIEENEMKLSKVFQQSNGENENLLEFTKNNILQQIENLMEIHDNICDAMEDHASLLGIFLEKPDLIQQKNPLEYFINTYSSNIINSWFLYKINFQKLNIRSFDSNKDLSELYVKYLVKQKNRNFKNFTITQDINGNLSDGANFVRQNIKSIEKLKFNNVKGEDINRVFDMKKKESNEQDTTARKLKSLSLIQSDFSTVELNKLYTPSLKKLKIKRVILPISLAGFFDSILFKSSYLQNLYLQKCFIDDESLSLFFKYLSEKPELIESLKN